jgi:hypothetical protein
MKKQIVLAAIVLLSCFGYSANAQVSVHFNVGLQPLWGPVGYDYVQYYYIPDIDAYYDVANQDYVYLDNGVWVTSSYLPPRYGNFDLYRAHKVVINESSPWLRHGEYRDRYYSYRGRHDQEVIRDSRDQRYWANPNHPMHSRWNGNGNGYGHERQGDWGGNRPHGHEDHGHGDGGRGHGDDGHGDGGHGHEDGGHGHEDGGHGHEDHGHH